MWLPDCCAVAGEGEAEAEEVFSAFFEPDAALELEMLRPDDGLQEEIAMLQGLNLVDDDSDSGTPPIICHDCSCKMSALLIERT